MHKLATLLLVTAYAAGCAQVTVRKVPTPAQYVINGRSEWTADMQRRADEMEGLRFYLPRPFVSVFESFPVATDVYLARGRVSPDGKYVAIDSVARFGGEGLLGAPVDVGPVLAVPQDWLFGVSGPDRPPGSARSGDVPPGQGGDLRGALAAAGAAGEAKSSADEAADSAQRARRSAAEAAVATPDQPATGISRRGVSNSNGAFAYQPLRGSFDIAYLPDFDEQYVVSSRAGLGNAEFQLNLGQGWSLQGFNSLTDNSELNKRIFDVIDAGIELAKKSASGALAMAFPPAAAGLATPRAGEVAPAHSTERTMPPRQACLVPARGP